MKKVLIFLSFFMLTMTACNKSNCELAEDPACSESAPSQDVVSCLAYFESWFYDASTSTCSKIGYSGCSPSGFQTKEECEACDCNN